MTEFLGRIRRGETPEEFRGDMGERRRGGGTRRRREEGEQHVRGHRKGWSLLEGGSPNHESSVKYLLGN